MIFKANLTQATLKAAKTFGIASNLAARIRGGFNNIVNGMNDGTATYRLNTEMLNCLNIAKDPETQKFTFHTDSFDRLAGFEFNAGTPFKNNFLVEPEYVDGDNTVQIVLPEIQVPRDIKFAKDANFCRLMLGTVMLDLSNGRGENTQAQFLDIPYSRTTTIIPAHTFEFVVEPGCVCITAASLQFFKTTPIGDMSLNSKAFCPAAILNAYVAGGTTDPQKTEDWPDLGTKNFNWTENN